MNSPVRIGLNINQICPVDYPYVHRKLKKTGVTKKLFGEGYCARCEKNGRNAVSENPAAYPL
jgi:hypothetical protein